MKSNDSSPEVLIIGAGMIVNDLLLPSVYHLQRTGVVGEISVCDARWQTVEGLLKNEEFRTAFPGQTFTPYPSAPSATPDFALYKKVLSKMKPYQIVIIALPDNLHYQVLMDVLDYSQHILCVKPLVLNYAHGIEVEKKAHEKGAFIGVEYHKRFDRRSLIARKHYRGGELGEFIFGEGKLIEPYYYRHSNFQNWFVAEATDPFVYVGCHYLDLVSFITGLKPVEISVSGIKRKFPNGKVGYMWSDGRVRFENDALLSISNGLGYPDQAGGSNDQGLVMFFEGDDKSGSLFHDDQFRGVEYSFVKGQAKTFQYINPDFFRLVPWEGDGLKPVGYGFDSVAAIVSQAASIENEVAKTSSGSPIELRRKIIKEVSERDLIATPSNSSYNELVHEAARLSILNNGDFAVIEYGEKPSVHLRK